MIRATGCVVKCLVLCNAHLSPNHPTCFMAGDRTSDVHSIFMASNFCCSPLLPGPLSSNPNLLNDREPKATPSTFSSWIYSCNIADRSQHSLLSNDGLNDLLPTCAHPQTQMSEQARIWPQTPAGGTWLLHLQQHPRGTLLTPTSSSWSELIVCLNSAIETISKRLAAFDSFWSKDQLVAEEITYKLIINISYLEDDTGLSWDCSVACMGMLFR